MKNKPVAAIIGLALLAGVAQTLGQAIVINSFSQNGLLVCSGLQTGTVATVQWASSLSGPWQTNWAGLTSVAISNNGTLTVSVPMFYRVLGVASTVSTNNSPPPADMALIRAGPFTMGDTLDGESDAIPTNITVSQFYMDTNLVTYSLWHSVYSYATSHGYGFDNAGSDKALKHPVQTVNWYDVVKWNNARSVQAGLTPVYYTDAGLTQVYTNGDVSPFVGWSANGYRLPTEAEWEKAARGGLGGQRFPRGDTISESQANYYAAPAVFSYDLGPYSDFNTSFDAGGLPYTSPVGYFPANAYGLKDMAGNLLEWCWDWYGTPYGQPTTSDPTGANSGSFRVLRGGDWNGDANVARSADRSSVEPAYAGFNVGFRCVRGH